jgi:hypothetical protein
MRTAIFTITLLLLAGNVLADPQPWMVKENPDELPIYVEAFGECAFLQDALYETVSGVLIRSRLKPVAMLEPADTYGHFVMMVNVSCTDRSGDSFSGLVTFGDTVDGQVAPR